MSLERIEDKLDKLHDIQIKQMEAMAKMEVILEKNTDSLILHEKRTTISENRLSVFETEFEKHLSFVKGAFWILSGLFTATIAVLGILIKFGII